MPTRKFGSEIKKAAIIECTICIDESRVLNLCTIDGYKKYIIMFNEFYKEQFYKHRAITEINFNKMRAIFFNYLKILDEIDLIVAPFLIPDQPYMPSETSPYSPQMHIKYTEVQICLKEDKQQYIINKRILEGDENE